MISLELAGQGVFPVGSEVCGEVVIPAVPNARWRGVEIHLKWRTEGRGDTDSGTVGVVSHPIQPSAGPARYPFRFMLPQDGPVSYHGQLLRIVWEIEVRIDVEWEFDPKDRWPITVVPRIQPTHQLR